MFLSTLLKAITAFNAIKVHEWFDCKGVYCGLVGVHRCTVVLRELEFMSSSCALCGSPDYEEATGKDLNPRTIIICDTCECEYHIGCLKNKGMADLKVKGALNKA